MTGTTQEADRGMERVRARLIEAAIDAYEDAGVQGLCESGRWEAAVAAMRRVDLMIGAAHPDPPA